jgi:hypothetical protein
MSAVELAKTKQTDFLIYGHILPTDSNLMTDYFISVFFCIVGGGVQSGPLGTAVTNRPIVPALGDYDDGEIGGMIDRGNGSIWKKLAPLPFCYFNLVN